MLILAAGLFAAPLALAQNLYRWVDEEGKVHFTTTLPPEAADRPYDIYSASGILLERVADPRALLQQQREEAQAAGAVKKPKPLYSEEEKQNIADRLLLLKYRSEEEIAEAMNLELDHLKYDERIIEASQKSLENSLAEQVRAAANRQRAGLPIEETQERDIDVLRKRLRDNEESIAGLVARKQKIREDFDSELMRYRRLTAETEAAAES